MAQTQNKSASAKILPIIAKMKKKRWDELDDLSRIEMLVNELNVSDKCRGMLTMEMKTDLGRQTVDEILNRCFTGESELEKIMAEIEANKSKPVIFD